MPDVSLPDDPRDQQDKLAPYRNHIGLDLFAVMFNDLRLRPTVIDGKIILSLVSLIELFGDSNYNPRQAWLDAKKRVLKLRPQLSENFLQLKMTAQDGKLRNTEAADLATCLKVIFSLKTRTSIQFEDMVADRLAKITDAELNYRLMNISRGMEWAADSIHETMKQLKPPTDDGLEWWQK